MISKRISLSADNGFTYRVKCKNVSWVRPITNIRLEAHVVIRGLDPDRPKTTIRLRLATSTSDVLQLLPGATRLVTIDPSSITPYMQRRLSDLGALDEPLDLLTLERLLELGTRADLVCGALAHDSWTGRQRFCQSHDYTLNDVVLADFETRRAKPVERLMSVRNAVRSFRRGRRRRWVERRHPTLGLRTSDTQRVGRSG